MSCSAKFINREMDVNVDHLNNAEIDLGKCLAKPRTGEVIDCLAPEENFLFCSFVLLFGIGRFCHHPLRDEIVTNTKNLTAINHRNNKENL